APALILYGASGAMAKHYDLPATWADRCTTIDARAVQGGHFFPDSAPVEVTEQVAAFLGRHPFTPVSE
ncbi:alpha/beta hydrolase, partial [Rhizobium ruizarguesonis]